jgi:hypothetical protein
MYTGTLIQDLIATVERAEQNSEFEKPEPELWLAAGQFEFGDESKLLGVA